MKFAFLGLGSNLGDRRQQIAAALRALSDDAAVVLVTGSSLYESMPVGVVDQPDFINLVVKVKTSHSPLALLGVCLVIESALGRERRERWGPRIIDLDLLTYANVVWRDENLELPHPRMHERGFVMTPLAEIAPELEVSGEKSRDLAHKLGADGLRPIESWAEFSRWAGLSPHPVAKP